MSFKEFSSAQNPPAAKKSDDKSKAAPATDRPAPQPEKKLDEATPAAKP